MAGSAVRWLEPSGPGAKAGFLQRLPQDGQQRVTLDGQFEERVGACTHRVHRLGHVRPVPQDDDLRVWRMLLQPRQQLDHGHVRQR